MAKKKNPLTEKNSLDRDGGVLYYYELDGKKTYVGRYQKNDLVSRARDHFYNAIVFGFPEQNLIPYYHSQEPDDTMTKFSHASISRLEQEWGLLMRSKNSKENQDPFFNFLLAFTSIKNFKKMKDEVINKKIIMNRQHYREINYLEQKEFNYINLAYEDDNFKLTKAAERQQIKEDFEQIFKDKITSANKINIGRMGISYYSAKKFCVNDPFWLVKIKTNIEKETEKVYNIIHVINFLEPPDNLRNVNLAEFLLTSIDIASKEQILNSLNDKIGDFKKIYNFYTEFYDPSDDKQINEEIMQFNLIDLLGKKYKTTIEYKKDSKPTQIQQKNEKTGKPIQIKVNNDVQSIIDKWLKEKRGQVKTYWNTEGNQVQNMLVDSFKYSLKILLPELKTEEVVSKVEKEYNEYWEQIKTKEDHTFMKYLSFLSEPTYY